MTKSHSKKITGDHKSHRKSTKKQNTGNAAVWQITTAIFLVLFVLSWTTHGFNMGLETIEGALPLEIYVMSQCPYGVQAEDTMFAAIQDIGEENFDLQVEYIVTDLGNGEFKSLHGQPETDGNIAQLCARDVDETKFLDLVLCMNKDSSAIPGNWKTCAEELNYDVDAVETCFTGEQGKELLKASAAKATAAGATGSPTILLDGVMYSGGRGETDFKRAFCNAFTGERPSACDNIPEPYKFELIVLNDERCNDCAAAQSQIVGQISGLFPGMTTKTIDYSSEEGKQLYTETGVGTLPALLFTGDVEKAEAYSNIAQYLIPAGDTYSYLRIGAVFDPTSEICTNNVDDTGNGLIDCADSSCEGTVECRETKKEQLQVFIMSDCPHGRKAVEALKGVNDNFENLDFEIHYIAGEEGDGFTSLHGQYEVDENIIQLCVNKYNPEVWFDYMYCRSTTGVKGIDWKTCAGESNIDTATIQTCFDNGEGADLLRADIKLAAELGIGASPTWLANNKFTFGGIDAETVKSNFCQYNPDVVGCENTIPVANTEAVPAGACG